MFWLIAEQLARFMLRLNRRLEAGSARPPRRVRVRNWAYRRPPRSESEPRGEHGSAAAPDEVAGDAAQLARDTLTSRQLEVMLLVAEGLKNVEIARCLDIGAAQVGRHLGNACKRANVATDAELMAWAKQHGIVPPVEEAD